MAGKGVDTIAPEQGMEKNSAACDPYVEKFHFTGDRPIHVLVSGSRSKLGHDLIVRRKSTRKQGPVTTFIL